MKKLAKRIKKFSEDRGWDTQKPGDVAKSISIEAAELLELFQWENPEQSEVKKDKEKIKEISSEVADVLIYAIEMCVFLGIDLEKAVNDKLDHADKKYPAGLMKKVSKNGFAKSSQNEYWKIKTAVRRKLRKQKKA